MAVITYTATRNQMPGHSLGTEYAFEVGIKSQSPSIDVQRKDATSLSGRQFVTLQRIDTGAKFETVVIDSATLQRQMLEFLYSIAAGEVFTLDMAGAVGAPVSPVSYRLNSSFDAPKRVGRGERFQYAFSVTEVV